jgi:hypothetical protein
MKRYRIRAERALAAIAAYLVLLAILYVAHARLLRVDVVFYSALADAAVAAALLLLAMRLRWFAALDGFDRTLLFLICLLLGYAFAISVPTVIDRSLSFYFLEKIQQRGGSMRLENFEEVFTRDYAREHRLVDVRLTEQVASGTLRVDGDCVSLTPRGERLADFSRFFRRHFLPRQRLLMGEYTDRLTDPFLGGKANSSPECQAGARR